MLPYTGSDIPKGNGTTPTYTNKTFKKQFKKQSNKYSEDISVHQLLKQSKMIDPIICFIDAKSTDIDSM